MAVEGWGTGGTRSGGRRFRSGRRRGGIARRTGGPAEPLGDRSFLGSTRPFSMPPSDPPATRQAITPDGSLGLLAFGYRGVEAWRAARGTAWIAEHRARAREAAIADASADAATAAPLDADPAELAAASVVVVTGLPRSGTSMMMQMLAAAGLAPFTDGARAADPSNPHGYYEHERVKGLARDRAWVPDADGHVVKVVAPLLPYLPAGPAYRVIMMDRSADEILRSQTAMLGRLERPAADEEALRPLYARTLAAAQGWLARTDRAEALVVPHRDALTDPAETARRVAAFLSLGPDAPAAMVAAVDPSLHRERA